MEARVAVVPTGANGSGAGIVGPDQLSLNLTLSSPLAGTVKNDRRVMVFNFFALCKDRITELPAYEDGDVRIEVIGTKHGVANMWDKELLIYIASLIQERINRGEPVSARVTFTANDFFRVCGSSPGGTSYERLEDSLLRLQGTQIKTNIRTGGEGEAGAFSWISKFRIQYRENAKGERSMRSMTVEICDWLFRAITRDNLILTYNSQYFKLGPLEKRLYEIARAHCGNQTGFRMNLVKLRQRVGSDMPLRNFKARIGKIAGMPRSPLPDYGLRLVDPIQMGFPGRPAVKASGRTPLKRWQVFFYPLVIVDKQQDYLVAAPLIDDDGNLDMLN
jgi:plasmid replication initiation protein